MSEPEYTLDDSLWELGVHDAHCHPTDTMDVIPEIPKRRIRTLTIMATRADDQERVAQVAREYGVDRMSSSSDGYSAAGGTSCRVVPSFGWHPWFSHLLLDDMDKPSAGGEATSKRNKLEHYKAVLYPEPSEEFIERLPEPKLLSEFIAQTRAYLKEFPSALVGEIGVDRSFRLPNFDGPDSDGKKLSPHKVEQEHQQRILEEQLRLAGELGRPVSVHGVAAHGVLYDSFASLFKGYEKVVRSKKTIKRGPHDFAGDESSESETEVVETEDGTLITRRKPKPYPPRICLHSFSAPPDFIKTWLNAKIPAQIYFSFSIAINARYGDKFAEMLKLVPEDKLLLESDLHIASIDMENHLAAIVHKISQDREWTLEKTIKTTGKNWKKFVFDEKTNKN